MDNSGVKVKCRKCGRNDYSTNFVFDPIYRMVVCSYCIKERKSKVASVSDKLKKEDKTANDLPKKIRPKDWDSEDEFLERAYQQKQQSMAKARKLPDGRIEYTCPRCKYSFAHNPSKRNDVCPYCNTELSKFSFFYNL